MDISDVKFPGTVGSFIFNMLLTPDRFFGNRSERIGPGTSQQRHSSVSEGLCHKLQLHLETEQKYAASYQDTLPF